ncbi:MAG: citrate lyase subunit alpha [Synergistaceae bacterium]|jgi:citrate lyase subunit alpha/citrate CoA-transferase|nr:citrate lyase subunit alpha [Synergistaceae bacterium]
MNEKQEQNQNLKMVENALGRHVPTEIPGLGKFEPYVAPFAYLHRELFAPAREKSRLIRPKEPRHDKVTDDIRKAVERSGLENGMTISFHHHLRNGDAVIPTILKTLWEMGFQNLSLAPSSLPDSHDMVADYFRNGLVSRLFSSGARGEVGKAISRGELEIPVLLRSHGGRARAVEQGDLPIDVAFLAAPLCDKYGNMTGSGGRSACGSLGYAQVDARYARHVIAVTDDLADYPLRPRISVPQYLVDQVLVVDSIGDPSRIATGAARISRNPVDLCIARNAFDLIAASGLLTDGCSFQVGAGGASLAVAAYVKDYMAENHVKGGFGLGGMSGYMIEMLEQGYFEAMFDVQSFDKSVTDSMTRNANHMEIDVSCYANPFNKGCVAHNLDIVVLAALDIDVDFNVNIQTGHDGVLRGAIGGHPDTSAGAKLAVIVAPSFRGGVPTVKESVTTICTPGETVDAFVTERGICINPRREDLLESARAARLPIKDIRELKEEVEKLTGVPDLPEFDRNRVVAVVENRDGTLLDSVYRVKSEK